MYARTSKQSKLHIICDETGHTYCGRKPVSTQIKQSDGESMCRQCLRCSDDMMKPLQQNFSFRGVKIKNPSIYPHKVTGYSTGESIIAGRKFPHIDFGAGIGLWLISKSKTYEHELRRINSIPGLMSRPNRLA